MRKLISVLCMTVLCWCWAPDAGAVYTTALPSNSAKYAAVVELSTGRMIAGKNAHDKASMASTTKIMTAILLIENTDLDREITCTKEMVTVEGSSMGLQPGDKVHFYDLLYGMMLASGNDAANTAAIAIAGSAEKFSQLMNKKAAQIGMTNTHFVTPSGLDNVEHYSTAYDMALLACYAMKNEQFAKAVSSRYAKLNYGNPPYDRTLSNHNKLLSYYEDCCGVKTGFTKKSGRCLVSCAKRDGKGVVCVTLHDPNDWSDHRTLLDFGLDYVQTRTFDAQSITADVLLSDKTLTAKSDRVVLPLFPEDKVTRETEYDNNLVAPIGKGDVIGTVRYKINGKPIKTTPLKATENIECEYKKETYFYWIKKLILQ